MDTRCIEYRKGMPFYPVTFPVNKADGLLIEDLQLQQLIRYLNDNDIKSAYICQMDNFYFLEKCVKLEHIEIELGLSIKYYGGLEKRGNKLLKTYDVSPLYCLRNLKGLAIVDIEEPYIISKMKIDLSKFPKLEYFLGDSKYIKNIEQAKSLKSVWLNRYEKDTLHELSELPELDSLELEVSKIKSLDGCEKMKKIQCLYLHYNRSLHDISALKYVGSSLKALTIENCGKIKDFSVLEELDNLESLELRGSNEIPDLSFIKKMKKLKSFTFTVNVLDGDISPCLDLQFAFCTRGKRHYNLKGTQLPNGKCIRGNENIEMWRRFE